MTTYSIGAPNKPAWVEDPATGEALPIDRGDRLRDILQKYYHSVCIHPVRSPKKVEISDGRIQVFEICESCGSKTGSALKQSDKEWVAGLSFLDPTIEAHYESLRQDTLKDDLLKLAYLQRDERGRQSEDYQNYKRSNKWLTKRSKVLQRCNYICEGCGDNEATQVYNTKLNNLGNEFLFDLKGVCGDCLTRAMQE